MSFCTTASDHKSGRAVTERWPTAKITTYSESAHEFASNGIFGGGLCRRPARQLRSGALRGGRISPPNWPIYTSTDSGRLYEFNGVLISLTHSNPTSRILAPSLRPKGSQDGIILGSSAMKKVIRLLRISYFGLGNGAGGCVLPQSIIGKWHQVVMYVSYSQSIQCYIQFQCTICMKSDLGMKGSCVEDE
jgi:hypothetical protein